MDIFAKNKHQRNADPLLQQLQRGTITFYRLEEVIEGLTPTEFDGALYYGDKKNPYKVFAKCVGDVEKIETLNIHKDTEIIAPEACVCLPHLKTVFMGDKVTEISYAAFKRCLKLENINLSKSLKVIGRSAFEMADREYGSTDGSMNTIEIPEGVTIIDDRAFYMNNLEVVYLPSTLTELGTWSFATDHDAWNNIIEAEATFYYKGTWEMFCEIGKCDDEFDESCIYYYSENMPEKDELIFHNKPIFGRKLDKRWHFGKSNRPELWK